MHLLDGGMQLVPGDVFVLMISILRVKCGEIWQHAATCGKMCMVNASLELKILTCIDVFTTLIG